MSERKKYNWSELIREQATSGKTINTFCKEKGIHYTSFYKSRKRLQSSNFVEVKVNKEESDSENPITLKYGGYLILLNPGFCKQTLKDVLIILDAVKC